MDCREHKGVLEDLDKAQVDILHVGSNRKNAADDKLKQLMRRWRNSQQKNCNWLNRFADLHRDGSRIVLIRWQKINTYESSFELLMVCRDHSTLNMVDFLKCLVSSHMIPSHSQWWHGLCCGHCRLQEKNVSLSRSSSQVQRSNIAIAANPTLSLCRFQIKNTKQSYPLQSQCLRIADKCCVRIPQLSGKFACPGLRTKLSPCIFFLLFFSHIILIFI